MRDHARSTCFPVLKTIVLRYYVVVRLVVDTGIGSNGRTSRSSRGLLPQVPRCRRATIQSETDRYIACPTQASISSASSSSVNSTSQKELGSKTDIGTSQDEMLDGRDLPLEINDLAVAKGREVV
jgi:uncharacterized protein (DUF885 family)